MVEEKQNARHDWVSQDPNLLDPTSSLSHSMMVHKTRDFERLCDCEGLRIRRILCTDVNDLANFALSIPRGSVRAMHIEGLCVHVVNSSECSCATAGLRWSACGPTGPREFLDFTAKTLCQQKRILSMLGTAPKAVTMPNRGRREAHQHKCWILYVEGATPQHIPISPHCQAAVWTLVVCAPNVGNSTIRSHDHNGCWVGLHQAGAMRESNLVVFAQLFRAAKSAKAIWLSQRIWTATLCTCENQQIWSDMLGAEIRCAIVVPTTRFTDQKCACHNKFKQRHWIKISTSIIEYLLPSCLRL